MHYIDLDYGWTLNNHLNTELFRNDNLHLNRKGYEKLSKLIIGKIIFTSNGKIVLQELLAGAFHAIMDKIEVGILQIAKKWNQK